MRVSYFETGRYLPRFAADSPLEEDGFELVVPHSKRTAVPNSPFGFPAAAPAASVLISESDDFQLPVPRANVVIRAT
jgi:hypothetical protein